MAKASTKLKGATSYKDTALGIFPRSKLLLLEIEGTKRGLEYIHDLILNKQKVSITPDLILKTHDISFAWIFPNWAGKYRTVQVTFSGKEAVAYPKVPELILDLCKDLETRLQHLPNQDAVEYITKVVELLAWFQHRFVFIHPFQDYNGRVARMLTTLILLMLSLPPIEIKAETKADRQRYLHAMQQADEGDLSLLETLISQGLTESLEKLGWA